MFAFKFEVRKVNLEI